MASKIQFKHFYIAGAGNTEGPDSALKSIPYPPVGASGSRARAQAHQTSPCVTLGPLLPFLTLKPEKIIRHGKICLLKGTISSQIRTRTQSGSSAKLNPM